MMMMMMGHRNLHRKLLNAAEDDQPPAAAVIPKPCKAFCDAQQNPLGLCPPLCTNLCGQVCKDPPPLQLLPDAPPPIIKPAPAISHGKHFNLALFLEIALALLVMGFLFLACYAVYKLCLKCRRSRARRRPPASRDRDADAGEFLEEDDYGGPVLDHPIWYIRTIGLQPSVIGSISIVRFKKGDGLVEGTDCSICLTEFEEDESLRLLPKCSHAFHVPCIDQWLRSHTNCPMCRAPIVNSSSLVVPSPELVMESTSTGQNDGGDGRSSDSDGESGNELSENEMAVRISEGDERALGSDGFCPKAIHGEEDCDCNNCDGTRIMRRSLSSVSLSAWRIDALSSEKYDPNDTLAEDKASLSNVNSVRCSSIESSALQGEHCSSVKRSASCVLLSRK